MIGFSLPGERPMCESPMTKIWPAGIMFVIRGSLFVVREPRTASHGQRLQRSFQVCPGALVVLRFELVHRIQNLRRNLPRQHDLHAVIVIAGAASFFLHPFASESECLTSLRPRGG